MIGCSKSFDIYFANPCAEKLAIETNSRPPARFFSDQPDARAVLNPESLTLVKGAFNDAYGHEWSVLVIATKEPLAVHAEHLVHQTYALPAAACQATS